MVVQDRRCGRRRVVVQDRCGRKACGGTGQEVWEKGVWWYKTGGVGERRVVVQAGGVGERCVVVQDRKCGRKACGGTAFRIMSPTQHFAS